MRAALLLLCALLAGPCLAREAVPVAEDPAIEQRLIAISSELRCLVCQNESLAASRAELALDLRREVRVLIARGESDDAIRAFLTDRYGDFILYRPQFKATTLLLWLGPALLLVVGLALLFRQLRRRARNAGAPDLPDAELSKEERATLAGLLNSEDPLAARGDRHQA